MSNDIRALLERMSAIESGITPVKLTPGLNAQQKSADQLPALFRPHKITALGARTDPQHPMKGMAVGASESNEGGQAMVAAAAQQAGKSDSEARSLGRNWPSGGPPGGLAETMAEIEEDMLGKIKNDLSVYLDKLADKVSDDGRRDGTPELDKLGRKERIDRDLIDKAKDEVEHGRVEENAEELNIGDEVIITGPVEYQGATGVIDDFGRDKRFVVVNLYNYGRHSFHSSDVEFNEYAGSDEEAEEMREENAEELNIGDEVVITGPVKHMGLTGKIVDFGRGQRFVVVDLGLLGRHSFQRSDVDLNDVDLVDYQRGNDDEEVQEDPTQQDMTIQPPPAPIENPTLPETVALDDGTIMEIHGNDESGYQIRRGDRSMKTRFPNKQHARMALDLFRARQREQSDSQDYVEEK